MNNFWWNLPFKSFCFCERKKIIFEYTWKMQSIEKMYQQCSYIDRKWCKILLKYCCDKVNEIYVRLQCFPSWLNLCKRFIELYFVKIINSSLKSFFVVIFHILILLIFCKKIHSIPSFQNSYKNTICNLFVEIYRLFSKSCSSHHIL